MPTTAVPLVHTQETTGPLPPIASYGDRLRGACPDQVTAASEIYSYMDKMDGSSKRFNLEHCRDKAWFIRNIESGEVRVAANSCHLRWCPVCTDSRRSYISHSVASWVEHQSYPKFLTLTIKHSNAPLKHQVDHLYSYFRLLRKRKDFKSCVPGGFWFFQIKKSKQSGQWHPHLHCLITGRYIPHSVLVRMWKEITYNSTVVDIRPVRNPAKACNDAARYAACPGSLAGLSFEDAFELVECMHGRRICGTWGTARTVSLRPPSQLDRSGWESVGEWFSVMRQEKSSQAAIDILDAWRNNHPLEAGVSLCHWGEDFEEFDLDDLREFESQFDYAYERSPPSLSLVLAT